MQTQSEKMQLSRQSMLLFSLLGIILLALIGFTFSYQHINHDSTVFLDIGTRILAGEKPYLDFFEVNPPLIYYLHVLPVVLAQWFPLSLVTAFYVFILIITLYSSLSTLYVLWQSFGEQELGFSVSFAIFMAIFGLLIVLGYGQREHLFLLLAIPFYLLRWQRWEGIAYPFGLALVMGFLAGIGMLIKPYFVVMLAVPEIYWLIQKRKIRNLFTAEVIGAVLAGMAYILFFVFNADIRDAFFNTVVPQLVAGYSAYNAASIVPQFPILIVILIGLFLGSVVPAFRKDRIWSLLVPTALFALVGLWAVYSQGKGWDYHYIPYQFVALVFIFVFLRRFIAQQQGLKYKFYSIVFYALLIYFMGPNLLRLGFEFYIQAFAGENQLVAYLQSKTDADDSTILFISTSVVPAYPNLLLAQRRNANAYIMAHPIVFAADSFPSYDAFLAASLEDLPDDIASYLNTVKENINEYQPQLIGIANYCEYCDYPMDLHEYLVAIGFVDAVILPSYHYSELWNDMLIYEYACTASTTEANEASCIQEGAPHD